MDGSFGTEFFAEAHVIVAVVASEAEQVAAFRRATCGPVFIPLSHGTSSVPLDHIVWVLAAEPYKPKKKALSGSLSVLWSHRLSPANASSLSVLHRELLIGLPESHR